MSQAKVVAFPQFAPLSTPFVKFFLERQEETMTQHDHFSIATSEEEQVEQALQRYQHAWSFFGQRVGEKRQRTYTLMNPVVQVDAATGDQYVSPSWLRETLSNLMPAAYKGKNRGKELVTQQTLSLWSERHVLRYRKWGQLEAQCAASVLIARQLDETRGRSWLPGFIDADEPYWWCFSQALPTDSVDAPMVPCPVPLPANVPPTTLLWTPWVGASWDPRWLPISNVGAIRWAGATLDDKGKTCWNIDEDDLKRWDPEIGSIDIGFLKHTQEILNVVAQLTLIRLAVTRLGAQAQVSAGQSIVPSDN